MNGPISIYLEFDHERLDRLLEEACATPGQIDLEAYGEFRKGLLRHIGIEEKLLFPAARKARNGEQIAEFDRLRRDHALLTSLLVPTPTEEIVARIRTILASHNALEEAPGGPYELCERIAGSDELLEQIRNAPEVRVRPFYDGHRPRLFERDWE